MPSSPNIFYKDKGWVGFGDFFGTNTVANYNKKYVTYNEAKVFVHKLKLKSATEWRLYCKSGNKPNNISGSPHNTYKDKGWVSWGDWLGTNSIADGQQEWASIQEAMLFAKKNQIKSKGQWNEFKKNNNLPSHIPKNPYGVYTRLGVWKSWTDFFGLDTPYRPESKGSLYMSFSDAKKWVQERGIMTSREYKNIVRPNNLPLSPNNVKQWRGKWKGWDDFLGKNKK